jgi:quercetin dioxygenase-like cupin family protein
MRTNFQIIAFAVSLIFSFQSQVQTADAIFPKGELSTTKNHTGNVWLKELNAGDSTFDYALAVATFDAGAKLDWHIHPGGQILLVMEGTGYYQERGKPIQIVHKRGCNKVPSGSRALARGITNHWLYLSGNYTDSKGEDSLARACYR